MHCEVGTDGEAFHPNLDPQPFDAVFLKGEHAAAYSGFEGRDSAGSTLADWLRGHDVETSTCAASPPTTASAPRPWTPSPTASPPASSDLCAGVAPETTEKALTELREAGVTIT